MISKKFERSVTFEKTLELPYPPSINNYYGRSRNGRVFIKKEGKQYRADVIDLLKNSEPLSDRLRVWVEVYVPDNRRRDVDNIKKALLDALTHAGVYEDDCLIDDLRTVRCGKEKGGRVVVHIWKFNDET